MKWCLVGLKGVGKTTLAKKISAEYQIPYYDLDELILKSYPEVSNISDLYFDLGEKKFREVEEACLLAFKPSGSFVLASSGGAILSEIGMKHIKSFAKIVYLDDDFETFYDRMQRLQPSFECDRAALDKMWQQRVPLYQQYADQTIEAGSWQAIVSAQF